MPGKNGMISPRVLLVEDYNKDFLKIEHVLDVLEELQIVHFHTEHQNALNFPVDERSKAPVLRIMYMNKNYSAAIFFGQSAMMLNTMSFQLSELMVELDAVVNRAGEEEPVQLIELLSEIFREQRHYPVIHN